MKEKSMPVFGMLSIFFSVNAIVVVSCISLIYNMVYEQSNPLFVVCLNLILAILGLLLGIFGMIKEENKAVSIIGICFSGINILWVTGYLIRSILQFLKIVVMCLLK